MKTRVPKSKTYKAGKGRRVTIPEPEPFSEAAAAKEIVDRIAESVLDLRHLETQEIKRHGHPNAHSETWGYFANQLEKVLSTDHGEAGLTTFVNNQARRTI